MTSVVMEAGRVGEAAAAANTSATLTTNASACALDDPRLMETLLKQAKSSHSALGRSMDVNLSFQRVGHKGSGSLMPPSAVAINRRERERQRRLQSEQQAAWRVTEQSQLAIPTLATMAPSFTKAADEGTEAFGGIRLGGAGYSTLIGIVPTRRTIGAIDEQCELISSFRPYCYDARHAAQQAAMRDVAAPHPDLLREVAPLLDEVCATGLIDRGALHGQVESASPENSATKDADKAEEEEGKEGDKQGDGDGENDEEAMKAGHTRAAGPHPHRERHGGTYSFRCLGRDAHDAARAKALRAQNANYHPRFTLVEPRTLGGYVASFTAPAAVGPRHQAAQTTTATATYTNTTTANNNNNNSNNAEGETAAAPQATSAAAAERDETYSLGATTVHHPASHTSCNSEGDPRHANSASYYRCRCKPGENVKGQSMFLSRTERSVGGRSDGPDVCYWPYPDVRSTTGRVQCPVHFAHATTARRREPPVSGVPTGAYDVAGNIADQPHCTVRLATMVSREAHWFGRRGANGAADVDAAAGGDVLDVERALRATWPDPKAATLPPLSLGDTTATGNNNTGVRRGAAEAQAAGPASRTGVSIESDLNFPTSTFGAPDALAHVRGFDKSLGRAEDRAAGRNPPPHDDTANLVYEVRPELVERRPRSVLLHPRAPGHGDLSKPNPTELGEIPKLHLVKPNTQRTVALGAASPRPDHLLPLHDLSYDTERAYAVVQARVTGDPMIGSRVSRARRERVFARNGCGANTMYNTAGLPKEKAKLVPVFEKQITKETQFCGHRIASERWLRKNPTAPGPGYYNVSYKQVDHKS